MKSHISVLFLMILALTVCAAADDAMYLYLECERGQDCIDLADIDNDMLSVMSVPSLVLTKSDFKSARIDTYEDTQQAIMLELQKEAAEKFEKITEENIGRRLMVVLDNKILTAPIIRDAISGGKIKLDGKQVSFWKKIPWLRELIKESYNTSRRSVMTFVIVAVAVVISACAFILLPRMKRTDQ